MRLLPTSLAVVAALVLFPGFAVADADALAKIVDGKCVPDETANGKPAPCAIVDVKGGFAALKDLVGASQFLLIATTPETGIEAPDLESTAPNYFADAWGSRQLMDQKLGRAVPRDDVSLAINSIGGRSQNRLHIHIDCLRADVVQGLATDAAGIAAGKWSDLPGGLLGHPYRATEIDAADLTGLNPFALVAADLPADDPKMADQTIVLAAATLPGGHEGFYLLHDHAGATPGDRASGEELQDHDCSVLK